MSKSDKGLLAVVFIALLAVAAIIYIDAYNCMDSGGILVRGIFWFECID